MSAIRKKLISIVIVSTITFMSYYGAVEAENNTTNGTSTINAPIPSLASQNPNGQNVPPPMNLMKPIIPPSIIPPPPVNQAKAYVLMDANSGQVLAQNNMNMRLPPASLTKLMTLYIVAMELKKGQIKTTDQVRISENAWRTGGSRMFAQVGTTINVQDLIDGIAIASGNDSTVAMAEYIAGSEGSFAQFMNQTAQQLGMTNSHFTDANGLPDANHYASPYDFAKLTQAFINNYPEYYKWFSQKWVFWNKIKQPNRNRLLWRDPSVDGVKTGHTEAAGFCLISSAKRNGMRLISVMMGEPSEPKRVDDSEALLNWGFRFYETHKLFDANQTLTTPRVWMGESKYIPIGLAHDVYVTIPSGQYNHLKASYNLNPHLVAPILKGQGYGSLQINMSDKTMTTAPLVALKDDPTGGIFKRLSDRVAMMLDHWFGGGYA